MTFVVITGGGSAGHVLPALAVAEALEDAGHRSADIHYVGTRRGIEARLLPATPYAHTLLDVDGVQRGFGRSDLRRNAAFVPKLVRAFGRASELLARLGPRVVVSVGGYASLPAVLAARRRRVPVVVVTYDRTPGWASALTARFAAAVAAAYEGSPLPRAEVTGAPVRRAVRAVDRVGDRDGARDALGLPRDRFVVAVVGGSLGSDLINRTVAAWVGGHERDTGLAVYHVVGERFVTGLGGRDGRDGVLHRVVGYEERIDLLYAAADLFVGRGGATTVAEVAVTGVPAVLVPWSGAAGDHQTGNVSALADAGGAVMVTESEIGLLGDVLDGLRRDGPRREALARRAWDLGARHRGGGVARLIERVALAS